MDQASTSSGCTATVSSSPAPEVTELLIEKVTLTPGIDIETIYITYRTPPVSAYEVFKAYEQTGKVLDVRWIDAKKITVFLLKKFNVDLIGMFDRKIHDNNEMAPDQQSPLNKLNALNDDCLMEIFERLHLQDLYMMAWVCKRFRSIAVKVLQTKHKNKPFNFNYLAYLDCFQSFATLSLFVHCLRIFSPTSVRLPAICDVNMNITLQAIIEHCPNLKELGLSYVSDIDPQTTAALRSLLPKLRKLTIPAPDILDGCADVEWRLEELHVHKVGLLPNIKTPRLTNLCIEDAKLNEPLVFEFLANNSQLTTLEFIDCEFSLNRLSTLTESVPNVEKLIFTECKIEENVDHQIRIPRMFQRLTTCEMTYVFRWDSFLKLLVGAPLDYLRLDKCYNPYPTTIDDICRLTTITELFIDLGANGYLIDDGDLLRITRSLSGLRELCIRNCQLNMRTLRTILRESKAITRFIVGIKPDEEFDFEPKVLNDISAMIAARPELHIAIWVHRKCLRISYEEWLPYANWLKVKFE